MRHVILTLLLAVAVLASTAIPGAQTSEFSEARTAAAAMPRLYGLVVSRGGTVLLEHYAKGYSATRPMNVKSAAKSIVSALTGIAIERGQITGVDQPVADFFPELRRDPDRRKAAITISDLLTMRSGLESTSGPNYGRWVTSRNWVAHALARPMVSEPGTAMVYSTGTSHILSAILTKATKTSTWDFARTALGPVFGPRLTRWPQDPQGIYFGGNDMLLTTRQMLAFGELYLNEGRHQGQQIVSREWVRASCTPRTTSRFDPGREYGYGWWIDDVGGHRTCYAWGYGGQFIMTFAELNLVVVVTSSTETSDERRGYRRDVLSLIERLILVPVAQQGSK